VNKNACALIFLLAPIALNGGFARAEAHRNQEPGALARPQDPHAEGSWERNSRSQPAAIPAISNEDNRAFAVDSRLPYASHIQAAAAANNVDAALIRAVITAESRDNPSVVSSAGAVGLMQLMPAIAKRYNVKNSRDPQQNIHGGTRYLGDLMRMFNNNVHLVLAAYNAGEQAVIKYGKRIPPYRETVAYVAKVLKFYNQYSADRITAREPDPVPVPAGSPDLGSQTRAFHTYASNPG
jgi:soluble lytic murein transglycosylase-like protein